jgi:spermidine/putrescine-binding protein
MKTNDKMKKCTLIIAAAVLGMTGCTKDEIIQPEKADFPKEKLRNIDDYVDPNKKIRVLGE